MPPHDFSLTQQKIMVIVPMLTGSLSLFSSMTIMAMMLKSKKKLSSSYRRIVFGRSMADMVYSIAHVASSLPNYSDTAWGAMGNQQTCEAQGFVLFFGGAVGGNYMMFLCIYFCNAIYFQMSKKTFSQKVEPFLHLFATGYGLTAGLYLLVMDYFNPGARSLVCWISSFPINCIENDLVDCIRGDDANKMRFYFFLLPVIIIFSVIILTMGLISWKEIKQARLNKKYQFQISKKTREENTTNTEENDKNDNRQSNAGRDSLSLTWLRARSLSNNVPSKRTKSVTIQATLYVMSFFLSWIFVCVNTLTTRRGGESRVPFGMRLMGRIFNPLQGFTTILVYTRPHVIALRRTHQEYSWLKAFFIVITSGGDNDGKVGRERRLSRMSV